MLSRMTAVPRWALLSTLALAAAGCSQAQSVGEPDPAPFERDGGAVLDDPAAPSPTLPDPTPDPTAADAASSPSPTSDAGPRPSLTPEADDAGTATCVVRDLPARDPEDCHQLDTLVVEHPVLTDDSGDGVLSPGEGADLAVTWRETEGLTVSWYPGVVFSTDTPNVTLSETDWRYAVLGCHVEVMHTRVGLPADVASHARIVVRAQVAMVNVDCPSAFTLEIPIVVGEVFPHAR
jgi:hypothetical protein